MFVALLIIELISDLHLGGKLMARYVNIPEAPFFLGN